MPLLMRLGQLSMTLKIGWAVWLAASLSIMVWRRRGRTVPVGQSRRTRTVKVSGDATPSKRRWRLRAGDSPTLQTSLLGL